MGRGTVGSLRGNTSFGDEVAASQALHQAIRAEQCEADVFAAAFLAHLTPLQVPYIAFPTPPPHIAPPPQLGAFFPAYCP